MTAADLRRERRRRTEDELRASALIPVACAVCDVELAEARFGDEVRCSGRGAWVSANPGVLAWK